MSGTHTLITSYGYDFNGNPGGITYPSGWNLSYTRDYQTQISVVKVKAPGAGSYGNLVSNLTHMPFGPFKLAVFANGLTETPTYDLDYRLTHITDAGTSTIQNLTYGYDLANNITGITDSVNTGRNQTLGYDAIDRLTSATGAYGTYGWTYDANGNRLTQTLGGGTLTYGYTSASNLLASITAGTTQSVTSIATGNISALPSNSGSPATLTYNKANQLASAAGASTAASYGYDAFGRRILRTPTGSPTIFATYGLNGELLEENDFSGTTIDYAYADGRPVGVLQGTSIYYVHDDHLGTPQLVTDGSKATVWNAGGYTPFGSPVFITGTLIQGLRLPGQFFDAESLLQHNGARDYSPQLGRYFQSDPIGLAGGMNTYNYAFANPVRFIDPSGLAPETDSNNQTPEFMNRNTRVMEMFNAFEGPHALEPGVEQNKQCDKALRRNYESNRQQEQIGGVAANGGIELLSPPSASREGLLTSLVGSFVQMFKGAPTTNVPVDPPLSPKHQQ